jgi:hypothetical protein
MKGAINCVYEPEGRDGEAGHADRGRPRRPESLTEPGAQRVDDENRNRRREEQEARLERVVALHHLQVERHEEDHAAEDEVGDEVGEDRAIETAHAEDRELDDRARDATLDEDEEHEERD